MDYMRSWKPFWLQPANGMISEEVITTAVTRLFTARFRLGMFDDDCEYDNIPYEVIECDKHTELAREMARQSVVMLKNDGILPLKSPKSIAVIGPNADDKDVLLGNYNGTPSKYSTILQGIQNGTDAKIYYARGCHLYNEKIDPWAENPLREAIIAAQKAEVVILCMGLSPLREGEEGDAYNGCAGGDKIDLELPLSQKILWNEIKKLNKPTIFLNISGSCINLCEQDEICNAVLQVFYPGAMGGDAVADILFGKASPSGRLPVTFYKNADDLPPFEDYSMENRTYKFFKGEPLYEFGHGLTYSKITERKIDENTVEVINEGDFDTYYSVLKFEYVPHKEFKDFKKIFIKAKEKVAVNLG